MLEAVIERRWNAHRRCGPLRLRSCARFASLDWPRWNTEIAIRKEDQHSGNYRESCHKLRGKSHQPRSEDKSVCFGEGVGNAIRLTSHRPPRTPCNRKTR